jgi:hypothetical protein
MRAVDIMVKITRSPTRCFLVRMDRKADIAKMRDQVARRLYSKAMATVLTSGSLAAEVPSAECGLVKSDLILTEHSASWEA